jgi:hypothetical protein
VLYPPSTVGAMGTKKVIAKKLLHNYTELPGQNIQCEVQYKSIPLKDINLSSDTMFPYISRSISSNQPQTPK